MKKRILSIILILILAFAMTFAGCGEDTSKAGAEVSVSAASSEAAAPAASSETAAQSVSSSGSTDIEEEPEVPSESPAVSSSSEEEPAQSSPGDTESSSQEISQPEIASESNAEDAGTLTVEEDGEYTDKEHVALYIHEFGHLPSNYVNKYDAMDAGWDSREGNLNQVLPGKSIGGNKFGNYEGRLPEKSGRKYYECDIDFNPEGLTSEPVYRNEKRIIYSNDGLIFYTEDHYETFEQLY